MPSGAKKRKAAKKKKEIQFNNKPNSSSPHGDDVKHQDGKESDVGEVSSPASQDHRSFQDEEKITGEVDKREFNEKGKSCDGGSSESSHSRSSSSSGSDDESHGNKNSPTAVDKTPFTDAASLSETPAEDIHTAILEEAGVSIVETPFVETPVTYPVSEGNEEKNLSSDEGKVGISAGLVDAAAETKEVGRDDDRLVYSYNEPPLTVDNRVESEKDHGVTQPLLAPAPPHVQTTSWKSCCGLFELFAGSSR
ncbi:hypothetical protein ACJIZ3_013324 [Penstemon smallii]|uniref:Uncharacterized protein n=1 Tax=Penstemon smallii TaxID=265156 RepID=A0ABD3UQL4_9LAMI